MFLSVKPASRETEIKRSRFIAHSFMIASRDEVKPIIERLRRENVGARHVCHGFIADEIGDDFGYDDDGEPSGTAGKPIYAALAAAGARRTLIAVVRYFGGIKLGAGGLTRAYRQSAAGLIEEAGLVRTQKSDVYAVRCNGEAYKRVTAAIRGSDFSMENIVYSDSVSFTLVAPSGTDVAAIMPNGAIFEKTGEVYGTVEGDR